MKGLIDYYIVSLDKIEKEIIKDLEKKTLFNDNKIKFEKEEGSDVILDFAIIQVLEILDEI